jgi:hypothetical protein
VREPEREIGVLAQEVVERLAALVPIARLQNDRARPE